MMGALAHDHPATEPKHDESRPDRLSAPCLCTAVLPHLSNRLSLPAGSPACASYSAG